MEGLLSTGSTLSSFLIAIQMDLHQLVLVNFLETLQDTKHLAVSKKLLLAPDIVCCLLCVKSYWKAAPIEAGKRKLLFFFICSTNFV